MQTNIINSNHSSLTSCQDVAAIASPLASLGINMFDYSRHYHDGRRVYLYSNPSVLEHYYLKEYYLSGNTECHPTLYQSRIVHWDTLPNQSVLNDLARSRNIDHGMYMIEPQADYCEFFNFATTKGNTGIINTYLTKLNSLKRFTSYFKDQAASLITQAESKSIILPYKKEVYDFVGDADCENIILDLMLSSQRIKLTPRQLDIVQEMLKGKTNKAISDKLKLSTRTIEDYIANLRLKLGCKNKTELVIKLTEII